MARILLVGNFAQKVPGGFYYNVDHKLRAGFLRNGHAVLEFSDRDQARLGNIFGNRKLGVGAANRKFLTTVANFQPDVIFLGHSQIIGNDSLHDVRQQWPGIKIAVYNVDSLALVSHQSNVVHLRNRADVVDALFISTGGELLRQFKTPHNRVGYLPNPVDAAIEDYQNFTQTNLPYDLVFAAGGIDTAADTRREMAEFVQAQAGDCRLLWRGVFAEPAVFGRAYFDLLAQAKMGLNFSRPNDVRWYASDRLSHIVGNGLLCLTARATDFGELFSDNEMVFYDSLPDLVDKIRYYAGDDAQRQAIARAGWQKAHAVFSADKITAYMLDVVLTGQINPDCRWAREVYV